MEDAKDELKDYLNKIIGQLDDCNKKITDTKKGLVEILGVLHDRSRI